MASVPITNCLNRGVHPTSVSMLRNFSGAQSSGWLKRMTLTIASFGKYSFISFSEILGLTQDPLGVISCAFRFPFSNLSQQSRNTQNRDLNRTTDLKSVDRKVVRVRLPPSAPILSTPYRS